MIIGVLGGTFDPPHLGHLGMSMNVLDTGLVDEIWFVPCLKHRFGKAPASFEHRLAMCRLLVSSEKRIKVSDIESALDRPGYTLDLVRKLMADHPDDTFRLIAGQDIYHQKHQWHHYDDIAVLAPPIYVARVGEPPIPEPTIPAPLDVSSSDVRDKIATGESLEGLLSPEVIAYIETHGLYDTKA